MNHFETQSAEIGGLSPELYEFKTVGRNDYPNDSNESPESDVTEESPLQGVVSTYRKRGFIERQNIIKISRTGDKMT